MTSPFASSRLRVSHPLLPPLSLVMLALSSCAPLAPDPLEEKNAMLEKTTPASVPRYDLVIVGATPAGITAAIAAAREGASVVLLERGAHVGGLPANGLGVTDIKTREATGGLFREFVRRVRAHYETAYGPNSEQVRDCRDGYRFEPSVAEAIFEAMLKEQPRIVVRRRRQFDALPERVTLDGARLREIRVLDRETGCIEAYAGATFIDATYEGDLAAAAGVPFRVGRESRDEYGEPMAGRIYKLWAGPVGEGSTGEGDGAIQAYNYRLCLTDDPARRVPVARPAAYRREDYASLVDDIRLDRAPLPPGYRHWEQDWEGLGRVLNISRLPNGKTDANNQHAAFLSSDLPEENWPWPTADWAWRDRFAARLRDYILGLIWFAQNDPELPEAFRRRAARWGLAKDEYLDNGHFPRQVYVREARRIRGLYTFTAHDATPVGPGLRPPVHADSVTASHYEIDSHACRKREPGRVHLDGFLSYPTAPYTVPYRVMAPEKIDGLLVPVAVSASHVGYGTLRMEPCWMALGEAAGLAAVLSQRAGVPVRQVSIPELQERLLDHGAVLIYVSNVGPAHPRFRDVQRLALAGRVPGFAWEGAPSDDGGDGERRSRAKPRRREGVADGGR